jgi:D-alanine transaminase/branched-chain amino acid aminotransferase
LTTLYCYANNEITPIEKAGVPVSDLLVQRGYGIFDFLRVAYYQPLFIDDHLDRFFNSASVMRLTIPESKEEIKKIVATLIQKNNLEFAGIRLLIAGGDAPNGYTITQPHLIIIEQALAQPSIEFPETGIRLASYQYQRQLAEVKTTDYLMAIWLQPWIKNKGADDILYYQDESITECPRSNVFMVTKENKLITPAKNMLKGVTRKNILQVAKAQGIEFEIRDITLSELKSAKEVFISSSTKRILPVSQIDEQIYNLNYSKSISYNIFTYLLALEK